MELDDYIALDLTHSVHTSERKSFRGCRRRWDWVSRQYYYPQITVRPLEFGTAYHEAMETYYHPDTWSTDPHKRQAIANAAIMVFKKKVLDQRINYIKVNGGNIDAEMEADYQDRVELGIGMLRYHLFDIAPRVDEGLRPKYVEVKFEVPITSNKNETLCCRCDTCWKRYFNSDVGSKCFNDWVEQLDPNVDWEPLSKRVELFRGLIWKGLPVTYGGRIDAIMEMADGRLFIYDWKTAAQLSRGNDEFLLLEDQITSYCWALKHVLKVDIAGFIWHEQKKAFPQEPEPMDRRYKGKLFSTNKQQSTNYDLYKPIVEESDPDAYAKGLYDEFLAFLLEQESMYTNGNGFFQRYQVIKSDAELRSAGQVIYDEAAEMTDLDLRIYPNPGRFHCGGCAFKEPCRAKNNDEDYQYALDTLYEKRTRHYWETAEPSTERKESA